MRGYIFYGSKFVCWFDRSSIFELKMNYLPIETKLYYKEFKFLRDIYHSVLNMRVTL